MEIKTETIVDGNNELVDIRYTEVNTQDKFSLEEEEPIRNEIINVLAKYNVPYWKAKIILERAKVFLRKESVVQEIK